MSDSIDLTESTILIVDDDAISIQMVQAILEKREYKIITAASGEECLQKAKAHSPDLILLDITMPGMSGIEVCKLLQQDSVTQNIPVIFVTADTDNTTLEEAFSAGGMDYVCKPINRVELTARIDSALTQRALGEKLLEKEKLNAILELAGGVCHELNQPLQVVSGYSQLLLSELPENDSRQEMVKTMVNQIDRIAEITRKLMNITRYKTRKYLGKSKIIDIHGASKITERKDNQKISG